jgi:GTPase SAR1 family protein
MKEEKKKYYEYKGMKIIRIGVIGNSNKGKSFLLSKISKIKLPTGTSIRTEGLSIKYPELEGYTDRKIVLLDSAGLETPVLKDNEYEIIKNENDNSNDYSIIDNGNQSQNLKKDLKEYFKEKSREKLITELFLQNYIIHNSEILI